jgi:hypothetical protein
MHKPRVGLKVGVKPGSGRMGVKLVYSNDNPPEPRLCEDCVRSVALLGYGEPRKSVCPPCFRAHVGKVVRKYLDEWENETSR